MAFKFFNTPVEITFGTGETGWQPIDAVVDCGCGSDVTGVMLEVAATATYRTTGFRCGGETGYTATVPVTLASQPGHFFAAMGVDANKEFEVYVSNVTGFTVRVIGYFGSESVFFSSRQSFPGATDGTWNTNTWEEVTIASLTGGDTAIAAIFEVYYSYASTSSLGARSSDSSATSHLCGLSGSPRVFLICPVNSSESLDLYLGGSTDKEVSLIGYIKSGFTFHTNPVDQATSNTTGYTDIPTALSSSASGGVFWVKGSSDGGSFGLRKNGYEGTVTYGLANRYPQVAIIQCDSGGLVEQRISATSIDLYEIGYVQGGQVFTGAATIAITSAVANVPTAVTHVGATSISASLSVPDLAAGVIRSGTASSIEISLSVPDLAANIIASSPASIAITAGASASGAVNRYCSSLIEISLATSQAAHLIHGGSATIESTLGLNVVGGLWAAGVASIEISLSVPDVTAISIHPVEAACAIDITSSVEASATITAAGVSSIVSSLTFYPSATCTYLAQSIIGSDSSLSPKGAVIFGGVANIASSMNISATGNSGKFGVASITLNTSVSIVSSATYSAQAAIASTLGVGSIGTLVFLGASEIPISLSVESASNLIHGGVASIPCSISVSPSGNIVAASAALIESSLSCTSAGILVMVGRTIISCRLSVTLDTGARHVISLQGTKTYSRTLLGSKTSRSINLIGGV